MAADPVFAVTPRVSSVNIATGNTARDGTGTLSTLITGSQSGTRIAEIVAQAKVTTTAGMVRIFLHDTPNTATHFFDEVSIAAATVSASVKGTRVSTLYTNLVLPNASWSVRVSTHNAESIDVTALGADL
jgi:hypothetical protein